MSTTILDDQSTTASDLNAIETDLGAVQFCNFSDAGTYHVDNLNQITADLCSSGILMKDNKCIIRKYDNGVYKIDTGVIVFPDGSKMRITELTEINVISGAGYIYAYKNTGDNTAKICSSAQLPVDSNYVLLATTDRSGNIYNKYNYARFNFGSNSFAQNGKNAIITETFTGTTVDREVFATVTADISKYNYAIMQFDFYTDGYYPVSAGDRHGIAILDITDIENPKSILDTIADYQDYHVGGSQVAYVTYRYVNAGSRGGRLEMSVSEGTLIVTATVAGESCVLTLTNDKPLKITLC